MDGACLREFFISLTRERSFDTSCLLPSPRKSRHFTIFSTKIFTVKALRHFSLALFAALFLLSCGTGKKTTSTPGKDDGKIDFTILQLNDVYEISPLGDGSGGLARVAGIRKALLAENPNTFTVLDGDFISPSVIGALKYEGKRIRGRQMVDVLNTLGLDWVVFGNHEFDYDDQADLQARLDESKFTWLGANVRYKTDAGVQPFFKNRNGAKEPCPDETVVTVKDADGTTVRLGLFGVLIDAGRKPWAQYSDYLEAGRRSYNALKDKSDVVLGITHLAIEDDKKLAAALPEVALILGGHEHENSFNRVGKTVITKADANAKTVYIHHLSYDRKTRKCTVKSELRKVTADLPEEPATAAVVAKWEKIKNEALTTSGFDPNRKVTDLKTPLDCREVILRYGQAPAGKMVTDAMLAAGKTKPDCALLNSGSIRVDDILSGTLTEVDVVRMLPFGGGLTEVEMRGNLLRKTLDMGVQNRGNGGYLQWGHIAPNATNNGWLINGTALDDAKTYRVILPDFLLTGNEQNMSFMKTAPSDNGKGTTNPDVLSIQKPNAADKTDLRNDIRLALIEFLRKS